MKRRTFLGAVAATGLAGCSALGGGEQQPIVLRATPADGDETDVRCHLTESFVARYPPLEDVLSRARGNEPIEWERTGVSRSTAREIVDALQHRCQETGGEYRGLYRYRDGWFFISVTPRGTSTAGLDQADDHEH